MIVGAGLAGLIAAHVFPKEPVVEARPEPTELHKALLRFRSPVVGELTGIEFAPVTVRKGIWMDGEWHEPNIRVANLYSQKVIGKLSDRSIWNLDSETRWIAPENLYERLVDSVGSRISWGEKAHFLNSDSPVISTAPMPVVLREIGIQAEPGEFKRAPIDVRRFRIPGAAVYQTVYFPTREHTLYRASITGDLLICEFTERDGDIPGWQSDVVSAFGLRESDVHQYEELERVSQEHGKIAPINESYRRSLIHALTEDFNIFSLGRFATWRNILLDDVVHDAAVIKRLINASQYERRIVRSRQGSA